MACVKDKIIVTGSTSGVGEACALDAAANGAAGVLITGRNSERGEAVARVEALELRQSLLPPNLLTRINVVTSWLNVTLNGDESMAWLIVQQTPIVAPSKRPPLNSGKPNECQCASSFLLTQDSVKIMQREKIAGSIVNILSVASSAGWTSSVLTAQPKVP